MPPVLPFSGIPSQPLTLYPPIFPFSRWHLSYLTQESMWSFMRAGLNIRTAWNGYQRAYSQHCAAVGRERGRWANKLCMPATSSHTIPCQRPAGGLHGGVGGWGAGAAGSRWWARRSLEGSAATHFFAAEGLGSLAASHWLLPL